MQIPGIGGDPVGMRLTPADPIAEPFEGDVDAGLLAIAEAVDDGLGRIEEFHEILKIPEKSNTYEMLFLTEVLS